METKVCENCDTQVSLAELTCPKCGVTFSDLEDAITTVQRANTILEKRKAKTVPAPEVVPPVTAPEKKVSVLTSLGKVIRNA